MSNPKTSSQSNSSNRSRNRRRGGSNRSRNNNYKGGNRSQNQTQSRSREPRVPQKEPSIFQEIWTRICEFLGIEEKSKSSNKKKSNQRQRTSNKPKAKPNSAAPQSRKEKPQGDAKPKPKQDKPKPKAKDKPKRQPEQIPVTNERLYVGNLDYEATEGDLYDLFNGVGKVKNAEVVCHKYTQRSKGYAFVVMTTIEEAKRAVEVLHDQDFMGRKLWISGAKSEGPKGGGDNEANEGDTPKADASPSESTSADAPQEEKTEVKQEAPTQEVSDSPSASDEPVSEPQEEEEATNRS